MLELFRNLPRTGVGLTAPFAGGTFQLFLYRFFSGEYEQVVLSAPRDTGDAHSRETGGRSGKNFDLRLQTIRGLAALVVAFHHSFNIFPFPPGPARVMRGVEGIFSAQAAVITFFILSGYVLGLSLGRNRSLTIRSYLQFLIKRVCRIMVPLWVIVCLAYAYPFSSRS